MNRVLHPLIVVLALFAGSAAHAVSIEVRPSQRVALGDPLTVDVLVTNPGGVTIGVFDIVLEFDPDILEIDDVVFGTGLTDPNFGSITDVAIGKGRVEAAESSLLFPPPPVVSDLLLFSVEFATRGLGTTAVTPVAALDLGPGPGLGLRAPMVFLGDDAIPGNPIPVASTNAATIMVVEPVATPAPGTLPLLAMGTALVMLGRIRRAA